MLNENDIIDYISIFLTKEGYTIVGAATGNQKRMDIIAEKNKKRIFIEVHAATNSKKDTHMYGKPFTYSQASNHIAGALLHAMTELNMHTDIDYAFALPDNTDHNILIGKILPSLQKIGVIVYFVSENGSVRVVR